MVNILTKKKKKLVTVLGPRESLGNLGRRPLVRDKVPSKCLHRWQVLHQVCKFLSQICHDSLASYLGKLKRSGQIAFSRNYPVLSKLLPKGLLASAQIGQLHCRSSFFFIRQSKFRRDEEPGDYSSD